MDILHASPDVHQTEGRRPSRPGLEVRLKRFPIREMAVVCLVLLCVPGVGLASPVSNSPVIVLSQQTDPGSNGAAEAARELSRLESARDFGALYRRMHPDALAIVPRSAVVGWYEALFSDRETSELRVLDAVAEPWTWGVTGTTYEDAVTVSFVQPYVVNGQPEDVAGEVHLVPYGGEWRWFFGASATFVDEQIALYGNDGSAMSQNLAQGAEEVNATIDIPREELFPDPLHAHVDAFWAREFAEVDRPYDAPSGVEAFDEPLVTACGRADPDEEAAFYCVVDEKIYYSQTFRSLIDRQIGDFAWVVVVAHEWAHHIQGQLGYDLGVSPDLSINTPTIALEQQADCLAGAYAIDAEITGWLDAGDIQEALNMTEISGDPPGTAWNDPRAHGTGDQRTEAFLAGYEGGIPACNLELQD